MSAPVLWRDLRRFTPARVALGRVGNGLPTAAHLEFQAAHAAARDAVHAELDIPRLQAELVEAGLTAGVVRSACPDRQTYLLRPDLGRRLQDPDGLAAAPGSIAILICDGLSATAVQRHAVKVLAALAGRLDRMGPIVLAAQGRVALGDDVGAAVGAEAVVVLIGERPGLTSPDSLGAYLTWAPRRGRSDAERNCISNIRPDGLPPAAAAEKLLWLIGRMRELRLSGVGLKDEQPALAGGQDRSISVVST
ncbi:Ethanolamine ammonia-lyase light chain [Rhodovastum atsumiense]|uniref:Ethanolamine ammonia-lyase small subunit n=1 Tax=Rhodovastum atsumiense TaxID=504468 RepID=A0A5M6IVH8_9PROT|nr:ethanolamine ammonia-lyase subunit EutC [Rhodovastum atsumiense]KAA5612314.1 ethanolamine ammonia-lyase subunit EutC [Rhodovastum atsumiense]CAH2601643.1 Ethanolamine ammonia-lyase light chain [Rhodovastum atsumiense]